MVTLFLALCREAGISTLDPPRERSIRAGGGATARSAKSPAQRRSVSNATNAKTNDPWPSAFTVQGLTVTDLRASYIAALIEGVRQSAAQGKVSDSDLLDRIERLMAEEEQAAREAKPALSGEGA